MTDTRPCGFPGCTGTHTDRPSAETGSGDTRERIENYMADLDVGCGPWCNDRRGACQSIRRDAARAAAEWIANNADAADTEEWHRCPECPTSGPCACSGVSELTAARAEAAELRHQLEQCQAALRACREGGTP